MLTATVDHRWYAPKVPSPAGAHGAISGEGAAEDVTAVQQARYPSAFHTKQVIPVGSEDFIEGRVHLHRYGQPPRVNPP